MVMVALERVLSMSITVFGLGECQVTSVEFWSDFSADIKLEKDLASN
jgi:hypothetical protein